LAVVPRVNGVELLFKLVLERTGRRKSVGPETSLGVTRECLHLALQLRASMTVLWAREQKWDGYRQNVEAGEESLVCKHFVLDGRDVMAEEGG
jgi:hypothetical protein